MFFVLFPNFLKSFELTSVAVLTNVSTAMLKLVTPNNLYILSV